MLKLILSVSALLLASGTLAEAKKPEAYFPMATCEPKKGSGSTAVKMEIFAEVGDNGLFLHQGIIAYHTGAPVKPTSRIEIGTNGTGDEAFGGALRIKIYSPVNPRELYAEFTLPKNDESFVTIKDTRGNTVDYFCQRY